MRTAHLVLSVGVLLAVTPAGATMYEYSGSMDGLQETPPNASPASGTLMGEYDDTTKTFHVEVDASGFTGLVTAAHIHFAPIGVAGPVVIPLVGVTGGTTYFTHEVYILDSTQEAQFLGGNWYVNVHSTTFPGGEIRGQIVPHVVPEPASLLALGLGALTVFIKRKR